MKNYAPAPPAGMNIVGGPVPGMDRILTPAALEFVTTLQRSFNGRRKELLKRRLLIQAAIMEGKTPDFLAETAAIRSGDWRVAEVPGDLQDRRVEITGPVSRKMMINALNSGANTFMADFEDANSPTWFNSIDGQINCMDSVRGTIEYDNSDGRKYRLNDEVSTLLVRPRGWHLEERNVTVDGEFVSGSLWDFGLYFFHNASTLLARGSGPYFYLPKLESHLEARLWNDVFVKAQELLGIPNGTIKATVLIETILAAFEMDEILYELKDHSAGLNAGRWDYIFSAIKKFRTKAGVFPDRDQVTMSVPFMSAYTDLLVKTCHRRNAHAMGGMAAFIPSRRDEEVNRFAFEKVKADKIRESSQGFDGTWIAHPDLSGLVSSVFGGVLAGRPNQRDVKRDDVSVAASDLLNFHIEGGEVTREGLRKNISIGLLYLESWLSGTGAAALYNLMEDLATAEISRSQVWQWVHHPRAKLNDGSPITEALVKELIDEEMKRIPDLIGEERFAAGRFELARELFETLVLGVTFHDFIPDIAYKHILDNKI